MDEIDEEYPIGKTFFFEGKQFAILESNGGCVGCLWNGDSICENPKFNCTCSERSDKTSVIMKYTPFKFGK